MTAADRLAKKIRPELDAALAAENLAQTHAHVTRALEILRPFRSLRHKLPKPPPPGVPVEQRRAERNERAAEIRAAVMERAGGRCEFCERDGFALEWHHIFPGGERTSREAVNTTCGICADCHHRGWGKRVETMRDAKAWALRHGFRDALREIEYRTSKIEEARRTA